MEIRKVNMDLLPKLCDFFKEIKSENVNKNIISMYSNSEPLLERLKNKIDSIYICMDNEKIIGVLSAITNKISNPKNDSWTITSYYFLDQYKECKESIEILEKFVQEIKETTAFKISVTFPADDIVQQVNLIKNRFYQEGYFISGIKKGKDLVSYALLLY